MALKTAKDLALSVVLDYCSPVVCNPLMHMATGIGCRLQHQPRSIAFLAVYHKPR